MISSSKLPLSICQYFYLFEKLSLSVNVKSAGKVWKYSVFFPQVFFYKLKVQYLFSLLYLIRRNIYQKPFNEGKKSEVWEIKDLILRQSAALNWFQHWTGSVTPWLSISSQQNVSAENTTLVTYRWKSINVFRQYMILFLHFGVLSFSSFVRVEMRRSKCDKLTPNCSYKNIKHTEIQVTVSPLLLNKWDWR